MNGGGDVNGLRFDPTKPLDVIALGRLCIDLNANETGRPLEDVVTFTRYLGGSPANIAVGAARLGLKTGFIGKVADDPSGGSSSATCARPASTRPAWSRTRRAASRGSPLRR